MSENGLGFAFTISELDGMKKSGKRVMKLRDGDRLSGCCHLDTRIAMATEQGSALSIASKEVPVRSAAAVGVMLMSIFSRG